MNNKPLSKAFVRILSASVALVPLFSFAATYYVNPDPALASDDYDGTAAVWAGGDSKTGPKLTLQGAMKITGLASGDTIRAAAGTYDRGGMYSDSIGSNRVEVVGGVKLIGAGADVTTIKGARGSGENGIGPGAVRPVYLRQYAVVQGFTITGGATEGTADADKNRGGGVNGTGGLVADCRIEGNICGHRGNAVNGFSTLLRCYVVDNSTIGEYSIYSGTKLIDSVLDCNLPIYSGITANNCLFMRTSPQGGSGESNYANAYNSIILTSTGWNLKLYNCRCVIKMRTDTVISDGSTIDNLGNALLSSYDPQTFRPLPGSALIDAGDDGYYAKATNGWNETWLGFAGKDFLGRVRKFGSSVDIGPGEYDWQDGTAPGLTVESEDLDDGTTRVVVTRDFSSELLCTGFTFGDLSVEFDKNGIAGVWTNIVSTASRTENSLVPVYATRTDHWYVNPDGDDANPGYHPDCPLRTLHAATTNAVSGDVIHAAPGIYREGGKVVSETMTRVALKSGVGLVSESGPEATVIEGVLSVEPGMSGPDSVRCAHVPSGSYLKGFTLRNGSTRVGSSNVYGDAGGGVYGEGAVIDCVISNCCAVRGGATANSTLIRCVVRDCHVATGATNASGKVASTGVEGMHYGKAYDSWIEPGTYNVSEFRNCWIGNVWHNGEHGNRTFVYNSYVVADFGSVTYSNCIHASTLRATCIADDKTVFRTSLTFDGMMRPLTMDSAAVDAGDNAHYIYPAAFAHEAGKDISGGQRIYNGKIDIGPGEYDWRGVFTENINRRGVEVDEASSGVTAAEPEGVILREGDTVKFALVFRNGGTCSFKVVGADGASVTVVANGVTLVPEGDVYSFSGDEDAVHTVTVTCGAGSATVSGFDMPGFGTVIILK